MITEAPAALAFQNTYTAEQLRAIQARGGDVLLIVARDLYLTAGTVLSWHRTAGAAYRAAQKAGRIVYLVNIKTVLLTMEGN